jgi:hypothetical protein
LDLNKIQEKLIKSEKDERDPQNLPFVKFLGRTCLLFSSERSSRIPAETKLLSFTTDIDEFIHNTYSAYINADYRMQIR